MCSGYHLRFNKALFIKQKCQLQMDVAQYENVATPFTPHLTGKKLSTNSPWDFEYVFETMNDY